MRHEDERDPIRRWLRRQQEEGWKEMIFLACGVSAIFLLSLLAYWSDYPL